LWLILALAVTAPGMAGSPAVGLEAAARAGHWDEVLVAALGRGEQIPLRPEEALIAAHAAQVAGDDSLSVSFLEPVIDDPELGPVARVELAELIVEDDPGRALGLVLGLVRRAPTGPLRSAAIDIAEIAVAIGVDEDLRAELERVLPSVGRQTRRGLVLALARTAQPIDLNRVRGLLAASTRDLVAAGAAELLDASGSRSAHDRWLIAQTYYRQGLYDRAAPILEQLDDLSDPKVPRREVAYLRGRCAFRRGRWDEAAAWYRKAIERTGNNRRRAELEVHLGRTAELAGDLDAAVSAAQRAVRLHTTDDRRLFLARLRLRRGEPDLAAAGLARLRGRTARSRGAVMTGLFELAGGNREAARRSLSRATRDPWRGPAAVIGAELALDAADPDGALELLDDAASSLDAYWAGRARTVMARLPDGVRRDWRRAAVAAIGEASERGRRIALSRALKLEPDPVRLGAFQVAAAHELGLEADPTPPVFPSGLADRLWSVGLAASAVRWDPAGFPRGTAIETWWTAEQEVALGSPWLAIGLADAARRQASWMIPARGFPLGLQRAFHPLPFADEVRRAADRHGIPWSMLAGVAREESRWNPRVVSKVGARGLMQLMPATAAATAAANGRPPVTPDDLFEPMISLDLGAAELGRLLERFDGNRAAAIAAYNAGEAQAQLWLDQCGEGCPEWRFLAHISFSVTRGYTEEVLASAAAYVELYGGGGPGGDLTVRSE
jgi:soluble lytic murein transglycosylase-like protein